MAGDNEYQGFREGEDAYNLTKTALGGVTFRRLEKALKKRKNEMADTEVAETLYNYREEHLTRRGARPEYSKEEQDFETFIEGTEKNQRYREDKWKLGPVASVADKGIGEGKCVRDLSDGSQQLLDHPHHIDNGNGWSDFDNKDGWNNSSGGSWAIYSGFDEKNSSGFGGHNSGATQTPGDGGGSFSNSGPSHGDPLALYLQGTQVELPREFVEGALGKFPVDGEHTVLDILKMLHAYASEYLSADLAFTKGQALLEERDRELKDLRGQLDSAKTDLGAAQMRLEIANASLEDTKLAHKDTETELEAVKQKAEDLEIEIGEAAREENRANDELRDEKAKTADLNARLESLNNSHKELTRSVNEFVKHNESALESLRRLAPTDGE